MTEETEELAKEQVHIEEIPALVDNMLGYTEKLSEEQVHADNTGKDGSLEVEEDIELDGSKVPRHSYLKKN